MKPSSEKAKSASKVSSRGSLEGRGKSVPKLRFPGFKEEWENKQLCNECVFFSGGTPASTDAKLYNGAIPFIRSAEIDNTTTKLFLSAKGIAESSAKEVRTGDLLLAMYGANSGDVALSKINGAINQAILCIRSETINTRYLKFLLERDKKRITSRYLQGGQGNLSAEIIRNLRLMFPSQREQESISRFIEMVESRIVAQRKLVELLKKQKRGLSNALFSGKLRMVNDLKWKVYRLGDIVRRVTRKNGSASDVPLTISAQQGLIDQREFFSKSVASADMSGYYLLKQGEFAYNRSSSGDYPFGSIKRLERYAQGAVSTLYICFEAIGDSDDSEFLKWYFDSFAWHREVGMICAEGARNHGLLNVPTEGFFDTKHLLPSDKEERKKMAMFMALEAARCEHAECELARLTELKAGFLQQMFA